MAGVPSKHPAAVWLPAYIYSFKFAFTFFDLRMFVENICDHDISKIWERNQARFRGKNQKKEDRKYMSPLTQINPN